MFAPAPAVRSIYAMHALARYYYLATRERELEIGCRRRRNNYSRASSVGCKQQIIMRASTEQHHILPILRAERISGDAVRDVWK
jgi:hypothetical protein